MELTTEVISLEPGRQYRAEDKASLLASAFHYGQKEQAQEAYVDWLYHGSPAGRAFVAVAETFESGEIVGFLWHVPFQVSLCGQTDLCHMGCNGLVHPDYRRQGIYIAFHNLVYADVHFKDSLFIYGFPKPVAVFPLQKVGHTVVSSIPMLVRPLDVAQLTHSRFSNPALRMAVGMGWQVAGNTIWRPQRSPNGRSNIRVSIETCFDESLTTSGAGI
jgi:hypothetical protein